MQKLLTTTESNLDNIIKFIDEHNVPTSYKLFSNSIYQGNQIIVVKINIGKTNVKILQYT